MKYIVLLFTLLCLLVVSTAAMTLLPNGSSIFLDETTRHKTYTVLDSVNFFDGIRPILFPIDFHSKLDPTISYTITSLWDGIHERDRDKEREPYIYPFPGPDLSNGVISTSVLVDVNLSNSNLSNSDFGNREMHEGFDVVHVNFTNANLQNAYVPGHARWENNNFTNANLSGITFEGYYDYVSLSGCDFTNADLRNADLSSAFVSVFDNYSYEDFYGSNEGFIEPIFFNTRLHGASLPLARDFEGNTMQLSQEWFEERGANFSPVPEPSSYTLLLGGLALGLVALRRR